MKNMRKWDGKGRRTVRSDRAGEMRVIEARGVVCRKEREICGCFKGKKVGLDTLDQGSQKGLQRKTKGETHENYGGTF